MQSNLLTLTDVTTNILAIEVRESGYTKRSRGSDENVHNNNNNENELASCTRIVV